MGGTVHLKTMSGTGSEDDSQGERVLSIDEILEVLSNYQRRGIINHLRDTPGHVHSIDEVMHHLKHIEQQKYGESPGDDHLLSVLVHVHGPKLEEAGLLDYDVPNREISYQPNETVERILDDIDAIAEDLDRN
jgi:hypothetical protein